MSKKAPAPKKAQKSRLQLGAGKATPAPPVATVLGPRGVSLPQFCKEFNDLTKDRPQGEPVSVVVAINPDKSFKITLKGTPTSYLVKQAAGITKGSSSTKRGPAIGSLTRQQITEIATKRLPYTNAYNVEQVIKQVEGVAQSMGITCPE